MTTPASHRGRVPSNRLEDAYLHHIDGNPRNNDPENLTLVLSRTRYSRRRSGILNSVTILRGCLAVLALSAYVMALISATTQDIGVAFVYAGVFTGTVFIALMGKRRTDNASL